ncbi:NAD-dependent protein deacetylase [Salana multivorans]
MASSSSTSPTVQTHSATQTHAAVAVPAVAPRVLHSTWAPSYPDTRPEAEDTELAEAAEALQGHRVLALTGAGLSTDSGIPDYRGPNARPRSPMTYQQFVADPGFRRHYWARNHVGWLHVGRTQPNPGHRALATLEEAGVVTGVITQNVDRLHQAAGSRAVLDLHGSYAEVVCLDCGHVISRAELDQRLTALNPGFREAALAESPEIAPDADAVLTDTDRFRVATCDVCGGTLKPHIVYFGENVPVERVARSHQMVDDASALLVAGTSLAVQSGLRLVKRAARAGRPVVIVNRGLTRGDDLATLRLNAGTSRVLPFLADRLASASTAASSSISPTAT